MADFIAIPSGHVMQCSVSSNSEEAIICIATATESCVGVSACF